MAEIRINTEHVGFVGYECPVCGNEEVALGQNYCQICGEPLEWKEEQENVRLLDTGFANFFGKESTQEEFFHTFNTLYEAKKQIIISFDN